MFSESSLGILNLGLGYKKYQAFSCWTWVPSPPPQFCVGVGGWLGSQVGGPGSVVFILCILDSILQISQCLAPPTPLEFIFQNSQPERSYKSHLVTGVPWHEDPLWGLRELPHPQPECAQTLSLLSS